MIFMASMFSGFWAVTLGYQNALDFLIYFVIILLATVVLLVLDKRFSDTPGGNHFPF